MSKHIKNLVGAAIVTVCMSGYAYAGVAPSAASLLLHGQSLNNAMSYSTQVPCPDQDQASPRHAAAAKPHKAVAHPHAKPKPKAQPVVAHHASEAAPVKKVVHVKRKPKPKPSFEPLVLAANQAHMNPIPTAAKTPLISHPVDPPILCEAVHRGDTPALTPVSNPEPSASTPEPLLANPENTEPSTPGGEAGNGPNPFSQAFNSGPFGGDSLSGPPGAIHHQSLNPDGGTPPTDTPPVSTIPEPSDWALMMFGLGGIGAGLRSRRQSRSGRRQTV